MATYFFTVSGEAATRFSFSAVSRGTAIIRLTAYFPNEKGHNNRTQDALYGGLCEVVKLTGGRSCVKACLRLDSKEYFAFLIFLSTFPDLNL
jgi:hypothetical protein